jgi:hypothetical protein
MAPKVFGMDEHGQITTGGYIFAAGCFALGVLGAAYAAHLTEKDKLAKGGEHILDEINESLNQPI